MMKLPFKGRDIISMDDFSKDEILYILDIAKKMNKKEYPDLLKGKVMASLFFEPSTRTRLSFETAMKRLGGEVIGFTEPGMTSIRKGETLWDTIKVVEKYADVIVMRNPYEGSARFASEAANIPVINAGDGANQHPTQTLLDLYTIRKAKGKLENLKIGFLGDLKYGRTVHSLVGALTHFKTRFYFISPEALGIPKYYLDYINDNGCEGVVTDKVEDVIGELDILYVTRIQKERFPDPMEYVKYANLYRIDLEILKKARDDLKVMHPLPRVNEIAKDVDDTHYALYFEQAGNGIPVRKALLLLVLGMIE